MENGVGPHQVNRNARTVWLKYILVALVLEKIVQHITVTLAFYFDWGDIGTTVAVSPTLLMILGAIAAALFVLSLWGMLTQRHWAPNLVVALALFDIIGEFVAQGTISITITVSVLVATLLIILALQYRRQAVTRKT